MLNSHLLLRLPEQFGYIRAASRERSMSRWILDENWVDWVFMVMLSQPEKTGVTSDRKSNML